MCEGCTGGPYCVVVKLSAGLYGAGKRPADVNLLMDSPLRLRVFDRT